MLEVGVPRGSAPACVVGRLLPPGWYKITDHCVQYHKYADDTQLHLAMSVDNIAGGLAIFAACTDDVRQWYRRTACSSTRTSRRL